MHSGSTINEEGTIPEEISEEVTKHKTEAEVTEETSEEGTQEVEDNNIIFNNLKTTINRTKQHLKEEDILAKEEVTLKTKTDKIKIRENGVQIAENQPTTQHNAGPRKRSIQ